MYLFERYMKKLKNYVQNKAKPKGSIADGYGAEEALTFSSHYFWDVTMKFNHPDRNVDCPPLTYKDPGVNASDELFALACGPTLSPISANSCIVNEPAVYWNEKRTKIRKTSRARCKNPSSVFSYTNKMSADVAHGHDGDGDGGGDDRLLQRQIFTDCQGRGTRKPNKGGRKAGRLNTRGETKNLGLRKITDK
nr:hypothetical protein [Tanacetum cinerariifolium]